MSPDTVITLLSGAVLASLGFIVALAREVSVLTGTVTTLTGNVNALVNTLSAERTERLGAIERLHERVDAVQDRRSPRGVHT